MTRVWIQSTVKEESFPNLKARKHRQDEARGSGKAFLFIVGFFHESEPPSRLHSRRPS